MQRKFLSNLAFLLFLNLLVKPFWIFGIDRAVQNEVGAEAYGSYFALFNFAFILNVILDLGISNFNNRHVSQHGHLLGKYFPRMVAVRMLLAVGYLVICLSTGYVLNYSAEQLLMLSLLCFNQFLLSSILFLRSNIAGLQLFRIDSIVSVMDRLLMIASCGWILYIMPREEPFRIEWFVYLQTFAYGVTAVFAFALVWIKGRPFSIRWNPAMLVLILKQSLPFALLILLMSIYGRVDSVLLERLLPEGKEQAGIYAQAFRLLDASNMIAYLFAVLLLPMFSRMLKTNEDIRPLTYLAAKLILIPAATLGIICWYHGNALMELLYHAHVDVSGEVLSLLMFSLVPMAGAYIFGTLLTANGNLKELNLIALVGVIASFSINLILIPEWEAYGAATACLATQALTFTLQLVVATVRFKLPFNRDVILLPAAISLVALAAYLGRSMPWVYALLMIAVSGGALTVLAVIPDLRLLRKLKQG